MTRPDRITFQMFRELGQEIDEAFGALIDVPWGRKGRSDWTPAVDIAETRDAYFVTVDLPGVCAGDIDLHIRPWQIEICGTRTVSRTVAAATHIHVERRHGRFCRTFHLEHEVDPQSAEHHCREGIFELRIDKRSVHDETDDREGEDG